MTTSMPIPISQGSCVTKLHEAQVIPIDACTPVEWNPNEEDVQTFNALVASIEDEGFLDAITVCPIPNQEDHFAIIRGEHRWKAAKLAGLKEISAFVMDWTEDEQMAKSIRHNTVHGKFDPAKFVEVWTKLNKKYGRDELADKLGMSHQERALQKLIGDTKKDLPKEMQADLEARRSKIRNVEDLASVVQSLYARFGRTLDASYMFLTFGGQIHLMIKMDAETKKRVEAQLERLRDSGQDANELLRLALAKLPE